MKQFTILILGIVLSGCTAGIPKDIAQAPSPEITPAKAIARLDAYKGQPVRWGGVILTVANHVNDTDIEILARKLDSSGRPIPGAAALGRFMARVDGFVDPADLSSRGNMMTIRGLVDSTLTGSIGEKPYVYPLIKVQTLHVWLYEPEYGNPDYYYSCGPFSMTAVAGIYPYGYSFGYGRCF